MERCFSKKQKRHLYVVADGKCQQCGGPLGEIWDAHHAKRYADGGVTEISNATALCEGCHVLIHRRYGMVKPREWQQRALQRFAESTALCFLLDATPGAGKTIFSALCFTKLIDDGVADFALIVVPTTALKGDSDAGFLGDWHKAGIEITTVLKDGRDRPSEFRGAVVTYQQLPNLVGTLETWTRNGVRLFVAFDEVHHLTDENVWGAAAERLARCSVKILAMTGTPFRGDGRRISFIEYDDEDRAKSHAKYTYRQAVKERVCRPVEFITDDGIAEFILHQEEEKIRLSEAQTDEEVRHATNTIFRGDSDWLQRFIERSDASVDEYRNTDADAGGLIVCKPGTDENDDRYLQQVAKLTYRVCGESVEIVSHDDPDSNAKIERFRASKQRWICAVRKISEGVDIKRLRVLVMATRPTTELLFRQLVGRVVRVQDKNKIEYATVYIPKFPQLQEWAAKISDEASQGIRDREAVDIERVPRSDEMASPFVPIGSRHEAGGAISDYGDEYTEAEINAAERLKHSNPQLSDIPITKLALIQRLQGIEPDPVQPANNPLQVEKKEIRQDINKAVRRLAIRRNPEDPDFKKVWVDIHKHTGAKGIDDLMDNYSTDVMRQVLRMLHGQIGGRDAA